MKTFTRLVFVRSFLLPMLLLALCVTNSYGQTTVYSESFDNAGSNAGALPTGWNTSVYSQTSGSSGYGPWGRDYAYACSINGNYGYYPEGCCYFAYSYGTTNNPYTYGTPYGHNSTSCSSGYLWYNCYYNYPGSYAVTASPAINFSSVYTGTGGFLLSYWVWEYAYPVTPYYSSKLDVYVNTSPSLTGAVQLGGDTYPYAIVGTIGAWYNYTFTLPSSFNNAPSVYIIFRGQAGTTNYGFDVLVDDVAVTYVQPCNATPNAPTITSNPQTTAICAGSSIQLTASDPNLTPGISFNWQSAPSSTGPWTNVPAGNGNGTLTYTVPGLTDTTYFRLVDSCQASHINTPSTNVYKVPIIKYYLPYLETFNTTATNSVPACYVYNDNFGTNWTVVNGIRAADGTTMTAMRIGDPASNAAHGKNNFFTIPGFTLTGSQVYAVRFKYARGRQDAVADTGNTYPEHLQVYANTPSPLYSVGAATGGTLLFDKTITVDNVNDTTVYFAPPANGSYYFSWYSNTAHPGGATSTIAGGHVIVDSIYVAAATCVSPAITNQPSAVNSCIGTSASLSVTAAGTANSFQWYKGGVAINTAAGKMATYTVPATAYTDSGLYTVTITNPCGSVTSSNIDLSVDPLPSTMVTATGPTTFCAGTSFTLLGPPGGGNQYQWYSGTNTVSGATNVNYVPTATGSYSVKVTSGFGCTATSSSTAVTINPLPSAVITPTGPTSFCSGDSVTLIASTGAGLTYQWYYGSFPIPSGSGGTGVSFKVKAFPGQYKVVVSNGTCSATSAVTTIAISNPPTATITSSGSNNICSGSSLVLTANSGLGYSYQWKYNGNNINDTLTTYSATNSGSYTVVVTSGGCSNTSIPKVVNVIPSPPAFVTVSNPNGICAGGTVVLTVDTATGYTYQWFKGGVSTGVFTYSDTVSTAGNYTVSVGNSNNCYTTSPITPVVINALPSANITVSGTGVACAGNSVHLVASAGNGYLYQWLNGSGVITGATGAYYDASATDNYKVAVTDLNGCVDTTTIAAAVTINAAPAINVVPTGSTSFCPGGNAPLSASPGAGSGLTYLWYVNGVNTGVTTPTYSAVSTGNVAVQATNASGCSALSSAVSTTLNTPPTAAIQANGSVNFCPGSSVLLSTAASGTYTYLWKDKGGTVLSTSSSYTATVTDSIYVKVTDLSTTCSTTSPLIGVTLNSAPAATAAANGATTVCAGNAVTLHADTSTAAGLTYQWKLNTFVLGGATAPTYIATATGSYTVVTSNGSCTTTSSPIAVTVNANPSSTITPLNSPIICANAYTTLSTVSGAGYTYQWKRNGNPVATTGSTSQYFTTDTAGSYTVTITNSQGCSGTSAAQAVTVYPAPKVTAVPINATTACEGDTVKLYANTTNSGLAYKWYKGSTLLPTVITNSLGATATGTYYVVVTNGNNCSDTSAALNVSINPLPVPAITQSNTLLEAGSFATYQWYYNNKAITGAKNSTYNAGANVGTYTVFVTDNNSCSAMSASYLYKGVTAVANVTNTPEIRLYPNPTTSIVYIEASIPVNARVSSMDGKLLLTASHADKIDLGGLANGVYMVSLYDDNDILIKVDRLVKSN